MLNAYLVAGANNVSQPLQSMMHFTTYDAPTKTKPPEDSSCYGLHKDV